MTGAPTEQQLILEQTLERFLRDHYGFARRQSIAASADGFSREMWARFADLGLLALPFSEADGGLGGALADVMVVQNQFGSHLVLEPYVACIVVAGRLLATSHDPEQRKRWLDPLIDGSHLAGLAHVERGARFGAEVTKTHLVACNGGWILSGAKTLVPVPGALALLLVTARDELGSLKICVVVPGTPGCTIRPWRAVDSHALGDVALHDVFVRADQVLDIPDSAAALDEVITYASAVLCAEALGCMRAVTDATVGYAKTRTQFGQPIGSFQALKHRLVDCHARCEQAERMVILASQEGNPAWTANVAAAKAFVSAEAVAVGHEAIQIHGAMGLTDELPVSHHHKRAVAISVLFGDQGRFLDCFVESSGLRESGYTSSALRFDDHLCPEDRIFRNEVREFLAQRLTAGIREAVRRQTISYPERSVAVAWQRILNERGWLAPHWPVDMGGTGWSATRRFVFEYESALAGAPEQIPMGFRYAGPVIAKFGSDWQRSWFLPRMLSSEHYWCQGFSEPGAGSDLASLKTSARIDGDHYVINGSKTWTTHAHFANWIFCIARTAQTARPQDGIGFFLIALDSPGIRIEPIPLLAVDHEVNQIFFDDVRVPLSHLVGEPTRGWDYVKFLLELERGGAAFSGRIRRELDQAKEIANAIDAGVWQDREFSRRMARLELRLMALERFEFQLATSLDRGEALGARGSVIKLLASELQKDVTEAAVHAAGYAGLEFEMRRPLHGAGAPEFPGLDLELVAMPRYLNMRVASIYGGSSEIQREIIAKHTLGLQ